MAGESGENFLPDELETCPDMPEKIDAESVYRVGRILQYLDYKQYEFISHILAIADAVCEKLNEARGMVGYGIDKSIRSRITKLSRSIRTTDNRLNKVIGRIEEQKLSESKETQEAIAELDKSTIPPELGDVGLLLGEDPKTQDDGDVSIPPGEDQPYIPPITPPDTGTVPPNFPINTPGIYPPTTYDLTPCSRTQITPNAIYKMFGEMQVCGTIQANLGAFVNDTGWSSFWHKKRIEESFHTKYLDDESTKEVYRWQLGSIQFDERIDQRNHYSYSIQIPFSPFTNNKFTAWNDEADNWVQNKFEIPGNMDDIMFDSYTYNDYKNKGYPISDQMSLEDGSISGYPKTIS